MILLILRMVRVMSRDITMCHPQLQELANKLLIECKKQGLIVKLGECFRSVDEQNALYAQGRTKPGSIVTNAKGISYSSMHQWGVAFDVIRNDGKGAYNDSDGWFSKVGKIGKALGLEWGGDWTSPVDKPHFQLPQWGSTPSKLKQLYGNVENFKKTWSNYTVTAEKKEVDDEVISEGKAIVNGKEYKIDRILKDDANFIKASNFSNMGFDVGYDADTKSVVINTKINELGINAGGLNVNIKAVNIDGYNYVNLRDIAKALGREVDVVDGEIVIR